MQWLSLNAIADTILIEGFQIAIIVKKKEQVAYIFT